MFKTKKLIVLISDVYFLYWNCFRWHQCFNYNVSSCTTIVHLFALFDTVFWSTFGQLRGYHYGQAFWAPFMTWWQMRCDNGTSLPNRDWWTTGQLAGCVLWPLGWSLIYLFFVFSIVLMWLIWILIPRCLYEILSSKKKNYFLLFCAMNSPLTKEGKLGE